MSTRTRVAVTIAAALVAAGCGGDPEPTPTPTTTAPTATSTGLVPVTPPGGPSATPTQQAALRDWIYKVGVEIQPGTYTTTAPDDHPCYWARLRSFGRPDSIIDDANIEPGESARVTVRSTDRGFKVSNGCYWVLDPLP